MAQTFLLPGFMGSGDGHWQRHWVEDNPDARIVEQDDWSEPHLAAWRERLESEIAGHDDVILVAHSLGCLLAAHLVDSACCRNIRGAVLVAPCDLDIAENKHPGAIHFGAMPLDRLPFPSLLVASLNDPYMPFEQSRHMAAAWGSDLIDLGYAGHINIASGFGRWTEGYRLTSLLRRGRAANAAATLPGVASHRSFRGLVRERRLLP